MNVLLGHEAHGSHHPFFHDRGGEDDLAGMDDVDLTILLIRNPFDTHQSYKKFVERLRAWGPRTLPELVRLWEKVNLHWVSGPGAPEWVQTEETSSVGRLLVLRYEHLLADPMQALSALVATGLTSSKQLQDALHVAAPAFRPSPPCHVQPEEGYVGVQVQQCVGGREGSALRAARNALENYGEEEVKRAFKRKRQVLQRFGYSLAAPGQACARDCRGQGRDTTER